MRKMMKSKMKHYRFRYIKLMYESLFSRNVRQRICMIFLLFLLSGVIFNLMFNKSHNFQTTDQVGGAMENFHSEKWIVITSINPPTQDISVLAGMKGWVVLVVADLKTPKDWSHPNCIYLSVEEQEKLNYHTLEHLKYNSYTRKNIGYLYAIQHGARYIYDTDDDNSPQHFDYFTFNHFTNQIFYDTNATVINPYPHFGQSTMWPRGYPLELIGVSSNHSYGHCVMATPAIQQGVVNGDPDVDAIYRMSRKMTNQDLDIEFSKSSPPLTLRPNTYAPYNSQNTLFDYRAFWSLVLPVGVSFRTCDIWRGYWTQKLLHLAGASLGFVGPTAVQRRNAHDYMADAIDEKELYFKTLSLIEFLKRWKCHLGKRRSMIESPAFVRCVIQLSQDMATQNFWTAADVALIEAWIHDLHSMDYPFPTLNQNEQGIVIIPEQPCAPKSPSCKFKFYPREKGMSLPSPYRIDILYNGNRGDGLCWDKVMKRRPGRTHSSPTLLVIILNDDVPNHRRSIDQLENIVKFYETAFDDIIFCSALDDDLTARLSHSYRIHSLAAFLKVQTNSGRPDSLFSTCLQTIFATNSNHQNLLFVPSHKLLKFWDIETLYAKSTKSTEELIYSQRQQRPTSICDDKISMPAVLDVPECSLIFNRQGFLNVRRLELLENFEIVTGESDCGKIRKVRCQATTPVGYKNDEGYDMFMTQSEIKLLFCGNID